MMKLTFTRILAWLGVAIGLLSFGISVFTLYCFALGVQSVGLIPYTTINFYIIAMIVFVMGPVVLWVGWNVLKKYRIK